MIDSRRAVCSPVVVLEAHRFHVFLQEVPRDMLREDIGGVVSPVDLLQQDLAGTAFILDPQVCCGQVTDFSKSTPPAYADCGCRICPHFKVEADVKIPGEGHEADGDRASFADARELCFSTAKCYSVLGQALVLDQVPTTHGTTARRRPACQVTAGEVCIDVGHEMGIGGLTGKHPHHTLGTNEVTNKMPQCKDGVAGRRGKMPAEFLRCEGNLWAVQG